MLVQIALQVSYYCSIVFHVLYFNMCSFIVFFKLFFSKWAPRSMNMRGAKVNFPVFLWASPPCHTESCSRFVIVFCFYPDLAAANISVRARGAKGGLEPLKFGVPCIFRARYSGFQAQPSDCILYFIFYRHQSSWVSLHKP